MERNIQTDTRLDWPEIVTAAKRRRQEMKLTQRRLASTAGVSLPTVVAFESGEDIRLSSALSILKVLDMTVRPVEGTLLIRADGENGGAPYHAMFVPYTGSGGAMEPRILADRKSLEELLDLLDIGVQERQNAASGLLRHNVANIVNVQITLSQLRQLWPIQFSRRDESQP